MAFLAAGAFNTSVCFAIYCLGIVLGAGYAIANSAAWIVGVILGFFLNSRFVFRKPYGHRRFGMFICSNAASLMTSMLVLAILVDVFSVNAIVAGVASIPFAVAVSYGAAKFAVFK